MVFERITQLGSTEHLVSTPSPDRQFNLFMSEPFPSFSPDGTKLMYSQYGRTKSGATGLEATSPGDTSVEIMSDRGADKRSLFHREGFSAFSAVFSPKGDEIALSVGRYFRAAGMPPAQIALIKPDGSDFRLIVDDKINNGFPSWSRDGSRLVFKRGKQLVTMTMADRTIAPLTDGAHYDNFPQWSPASDLIMYTSDRDGDFELYTIRPDGTDRRRLTNASGAMTRTLPGAPTATGLCSAAGGMDSRTRWPSTTACRSLTVKSSPCVPTDRMCASSPTTNGKTRARRAG